MSVRLSPADAARLGLTPDQSPARPRRRQSNPEGQLLKAILAQLAARRIYAWRNQTTGLYDPTQKRFRKFQGLKGVSDILGVLPGSPRNWPGKLLAVEVKSAKGRVSDEQRLFLDNVTRHGGLAIVARSVDDLVEALKAGGYA